MNETEITTDGQRNVRPGRQATTGVNVAPSTGQVAARKRATSKADHQMVPDAEFSSYYGLPIINQPTWQAPDIAGYLFLGGLAGAGSVIAAGADMTGRPMLARTLKTGCMAAGGLSLLALVHDLGRPKRFVNMLRTFKVTSPMSVGSWLLSVYVPAAGAAALSALTGIAPAAGAAATGIAAMLGPGVASYTGALMANTAVPAWHDGYRTMPFLFVASGASAAAGLGLLGAPLVETTPVRRLAVAAGITELALERVMEKRMGLTGETFHLGRAKRYRWLAEVLTGVGVAGAALASRRSRTVSAVSGAALMAGSAFTRFAVFEAGMISARDPKYIVVPQRERLAERTSRGTLG